MFVDRHSGDEYRNLHRQRAEILFAKHESVYKSSATYARIPVNSLASNYALSLPAVFGAEWTWLVENTRLPHDDAKTTMFSKSRTRAAFVSAAAFDFLDGRPEKERIMFISGDSWTTSLPSILPVCFVQAFRIYLSIHINNIKSLPEDIHDRFCDLLPDIQHDEQFINFDFDRYWFDFSSQRLAKVSTGAVKDKLVSWLFDWCDTKQEWKTKRAGLRMECPTQAGESHAWVTEWLAGDFSKCMIAYGQKLFATGE